jgi:hypothetical protein
LKKIIAVLAIGTAALTGCGADQEQPTSAPATTVTTTSAPPVTEGVPSGLTAEDKAFLTVVYRAFPEESPVVGMSPELDEQMIKLGHLVCAGLIAGNSEASAISVIGGDGSITYSQAATIVGAAEGAYCPEVSTQ